MTATINCPPLPESLKGASHVGRLAHNHSLLEWRDAVVDHLKVLKAKSRAGESIVLEDRQVSIEIKAFIATRSAGDSVKNRLDEGCFFWDVCGAAIDAGAKHACAFMLSQYEKNPSIGENFLPRVFVADAGYALPLLLKNGWSSAWEKNTQGWDVMAWACLAPECRQWMLTNRPEEVFSVNEILEEGERPYEVFKQHWSALADSILLVKKSSDLPFFTRRLGVFVKAVASELGYFFQDPLVHKKLALEACETLAWQLTSEPRKSYDEFDLEARLDAAEVWWSTLSRHTVVPKNTWDEAWLEAKEGLTGLDDLYNNVMLKWQSRRERAWLLERHAQGTKKTIQRVAL